MGIFDFFKGKKESNAEKEPVKSPPAAAAPELVSLDKEPLKEKIKEHIEEPQAKDAFLDKVLPKCRNHTATAIAIGKVLQIELDGKWYDQPADSLPYVHGFDDDYGILYTIDMEMAYTYLTQKQVKESGLDRDALYNRSKENFFRFFQNNAQYGPLDTDDDIYRCSLDGNQDASIGLFPELLQHLSEQVGFKNASFAMPTTYSYLFWDADRDAELKDKVIKNCTSLWKDCRPKDRVSIVANTVDFEKGQMRRAFQVVRDEDLDEIYLPETTTVKVGQYLLAKEGRQQGFFKDAVVLVCMAKDEQVVGVRIDTSSGKVLSEAVPSLQSDQFTIEVGGPGNKDSFIFLHQVPELGTDNEVLDGLYFLGDAQRLKDMVSNKVIGKGQVRFFTGLSVWTKDQLEVEIKVGAWTVRDAQADDFMDDPAPDLWERLSSTS